MLVTAFGREIKHLRAERDLTVRDLADRLGKSVAYIGKIETQGEIPNPEVICQLAEILGDEPQRLLVLAKQTKLASYERQLDAHYNATFIDSIHPGMGQGTDQRKGAKRMATVVSLINMKGGVGKTTLANQLAHAADITDMKVLAVD